jgi:hypothetical protein
MPFEAPPPTWLWGQEAIQHIQKAERRTEAEAIEQLKNAIAHRKVTARLPDPTRPGRMASFPPGIENVIGFHTGPGSTPMVTPAGLPSSPTPAEWMTAKILASGTVQFPTYRTVQWYTFQVRRDEVLQVWPERPSQSAKVVSLADRNKGGRPSFFPDVAQILERLLADVPTLIHQIDQGGGFKSLADTIRKNAGKQAEDDGWSDTTLREHIRKWRKSKRPRE